MWEEWVEVVVIAESVPPFPMAVVCTGALRTDASAYG